MVYLWLSVISFLMATCRIVWNAKNVASFVLTLKSMLKCLMVLLISRTKIFIIICGEQIHGSLIGD